MISNDSFYLYDAQGRLAAKRVNNGKDLLYGEKGQITQQFDYSVSVENNLYNINGLDGIWAYIGDGKIDDRCGTPECRTIEALTFDEVAALYLSDNGPNSSGTSSKIPTSELQKWFNAHGVTDAKINNSAKDEYGRSSQSITFTYEGKSYEWNQVSYEVANSYYYLNGVTDREDVDGFGHTVHVNNAQELRSALEKYAEDRDYLIVIDQDINMAGVDWTPIPKLSASILGGEHTISNLTVNDNGENVGLFRVIDDYCEISDLTFENANITNTNTSYDSGTGVLAGKIGAKTVCRNVSINNSTVTGGGCAGMMTGELEGVNGSKNKVITKCDVNNCTVSGDYATGGVIGHGTNADGTGAIVSDITVNGGQWAGGIAGSVDFDGSCPTPSGMFTNVTINGGYHDKVTLGAGGLAGRIGATGKNETSTWVDIYTTGADNEKNVSINNAYAEGILVGWYCELDSETGKVTQNCNSPIGGNVNGKPIIGKAGIDENSIVTTYAGASKDIPANVVLEEFAKANNLTPVPNMEGTCYQDSNGVKYFLSGGRIAASDWDMSIDAYKKLHVQGGETIIDINDVDASGRVDSHGYPMTPETAYWELGEDGKLHAYGIGFTSIGMFFNRVNASEWEYLLTNLGAVNYYFKDSSSREDSGQYKGSETFQEIYYQTADGEWHKMTRSASNALYDPKAYLESGVLKTAESENYGNFTFEEYMKAFCGTPETIKLTGGPEDNYEIRAPWFCIEDLSYEEVYEQISNNLSVQPPYNTGYVDDGEDGFVITNREIPTGLEGIDLDPHPENATFEDYKNMLVITNFLKAEISPDGYSNILSQPRYEVSLGSEDLIDTWTRLPGGIELTEANLEQYKHLITLLDKDQAKEKVIEKLSSYSAQLQGVTRDSNGQPVLKEWLSYLLDAIGATNVNIISEGNDAGGVTFSFAYVRPAYISFDLDGSHQEVGICPTAKGACPPQSAIVPAEEVEDLRNYMPEDEYQRLLNYYFTPTYTVNGDVQTYMFSWTADVTGFKLKFGDAPQSVLYEYVNGQTLAFDTMWRGGNGYGDPFSCTGYQRMVEWIKNHDVAARYEYTSEVFNETADDTNYKINSEIKDLGLSQEVLDWYFESDGSISFRKDPDVDFPVLTNVEDFIAYAKSHDLNAEFAACMEKKQAVETERTSQTTSSANANKQAENERQDYANRLYNQVKVQLEGNSVALNYFSWNISVYIDKYVKGSITQAEFDTTMLKVLNDAKRKITNPGKNDSINEK